MMPRKKTYVSINSKEVYSLRQGEMNVRVFYRTLKAKWEDLNYNTDM